jgi:hypothetical protein
LAFSIPPAARFHNAQAQPNASCTLARAQAQSPSLPPQSQHLHTLPAVVASQALARWTVRYLPVALPSLTHTVPGNQTSAVYRSPQPAGIAAAPPSDSPGHHATSVSKVSGCLLFAGLPTRTWSHRQSALVFSSVEAPCGNVSPPRWRPNIAAWRRRPIQRHWIRPTGTGASAWTRRQNRGTDTGRGRDVAASTNAATLETRSLAASADRCRPRFGTSEATRRLDLQPRLHVP